MTQGLGKAAHACNSSSLKLKQEDLLEVKSRREKRKGGIIQGQRAHSDEYMKNVDPFISFAHELGLQEAFLHVYTSHRTLGRIYIPKIKSHLSSSLNRLYITSFMRKAFSLCS